MRSILADSSIVKVRRFNPDALAAYRSDKHFIYDAVAPPQESIFMKFWRHFWEMIERLFRSSGDFIPGNLVKVLLVLILLAAIVYAVFHLNGLDLKMFFRKSKSIHIPYHEDIENIHEINFEEEIEHAIAQGNYRLAVRLLYLRTLKGLSDQGLIYWQPEKTNQTYVNEISDLQRKTGFAQLTRQFEYVWYGDLSIEKENFQRIRSDFQQFNPK